MKLTIEWNDSSKITIIRNVERLGYDGYDLFVYVKNEVEIRQFGVGVIASYALVMD